MTMPELSPEQRAERERIEQSYGGADGADHYYGHLAALLRATEERIQEGYTPQIPEDVGYFENLRDKIMARMQELGISTDILGYNYTDNSSQFQDLRE